MDKYEIDLRWGKAFVIAQSYVERDGQYVFLYSGADGRVHVKAVYNISDCVSAPIVVEVDVRSAHEK